MEKAEQDRGMGHCCLFPSDFLDAHTRYWEDGEELFEHGRLATADHLFGLCAECGLKALMVVAGMTTDPLGVPSQEYKTHINRLWDKFVSFAQGRTIERYAMELPVTNPFGDWYASNRYAHRRHFSRGIVEVHRDGASLIRRIVNAAQRDGVLQ